MSADDAVARTPPGLDTPLSAPDVQRDPLGFLQGLAARFGDIARYTLDGHVVVFVNRPEYARHVLQSAHRRYAKAGTPDMAMLKPMLGDGLLTTDGDAWLAQRRLTAPSFHRSAVAAFGGLIVEETERTMAGWVARADAGVFELGDELTQLTTRIVARALFGADVGELVTRFGAAVQAMNEFMGHYDPDDRDRLQRFLEARTLVDALVRGIIARRRMEPDAGEDDFLAVLLAARTEDGDPLPARSVRDQVMTLLMAGHETTAKALTWTLDLLDRHPGWAERIRREADDVLGERTPGVEDLPRLPTAWWVIQEAMRLYPPVWVISRVATEDDILDGWAIPTGTLVLVSPWMLHRHPAAWARPETFNPERFMPDREESRPPFAYVPFSGGPRQCIGKPLATIEAHLALVLLLRRWDIRVDRSIAVEPEALVTLRPRNGLHATVRPRAQWEPTPHR